MRIIKKFAQQFEKPEGFLGIIAGMLMSTVGTEKNRWTISLLNVRKDDNVLEIGFGPGIGIELTSKVIQDGKIFGIDYSEKMLQQAQKRNKDAIQKGQVELILTDVQNLPSFNLRFDKVFSINSIIFWEKPVETLKGIRELMKENGMIAITVQPFMKGATEETTKQLGTKIINHLKEAGYSDIKMEIKHMKPVATVCVLGVNI
ncbi:class I SAM-dependent methyltransferase [Salinibacillus xinjiangensis]|uniref:Methyltransferase domain-containing protein n=1 Tax=Salinibacillus xinjiangensis TaxID=1229268 RepID=A0A6G1X4S6_9BACI|nr:class I SAM-dependent methyltransferase [Salinibacillus xinjiangensis]MRG86001.1 methyltransferase domain-containing protein [Salinibacillus xinjiangensis]